MNTNNNMNRAKQAKNDEFYTKIEDIEAEILGHEEYPPQFKDKIIFCNCDDAESAFYRFFKQYFDKLGIKAVIAAKYDQTGENTYLISYTGKSEKKHPISGTGGFDCGACLWALNDVDLIVTNPPFSRMLDFIKVLESNHKQYLIIGNKNSASCKDIFPLFMEGRLHFGHNFVKKFDRPDNQKDRHGNIGWFTNLNVTVENEPLVLTKTYEGHEAEYPVYDNFPAINVNRLEDIPEDYDDYMGVPTTILDKDYEYGFELIGLSGTLAKPVIIDGKKHIGRFYIDGNRQFERVVIKKKLIPVIDVRKCEDIPKDFFGIMGVPINFIDKWDPNQFELIGEANHGSDSEYDLFSPAVNGVHRCRRLLIRQIPPSRG